MRSWKLYEQRLAHLLGGQRVRGSGCGYRKGDVWVGKDWMVECKTTSKPTYTLTTRVLDKLAQESLLAGLSAALIIVFEQPQPAEFVVLLLSKRGTFQPNWRSKRISGETLLAVPVLLSERAEWQPMTLDQFITTIRPPQL